MNLSLDDLSDFGRARLEDDYAAVQRRDVNKTSRADFGLGWMAAMVRIRQWSYFTPETRARLDRTVVVTP